MTPNQKANDLINLFYTDIYSFSSYLDIFAKRDLAMKFAKKVCDEVLSDMGADRGVIFWEAVKTELDMMMAENIKQALNPITRSIDEDKNEPGFDYYK